MKEPFLVTAFYKFVSLSEENLEKMRSKILATATELDLRGLCILGTEGINATIAGRPEGIQSFKSFLFSEINLSRVMFKDSECYFQPFRRLVVQIRPELVTLGRTNLIPHERDESHLSPEEWQRILDEDPEVIVLDVRNEYETALGKFRDAVDPHLKSFGEFHDFLKRKAIPKEKKILTYCTGGIRCEKAVLEMREQGYTNVFQLHGGILNYLEKYPEGYFTGECFVFDHRVSVDHRLQPSRRYRLCPHCGNPGDRSLVCRQCGAEATVCEVCSRELCCQTCSKNCRNHFKRINEAQRA